MQQVFPHTFSLLCLASLMFQTARGDTLRVGAPFPDIQFQLVSREQPARLCRLPEIVQDKTIVFVFASW